jgi:hypothetical protein
VDLLEIEPIALRKSLSSKSCQSCSPRRITSVDSAAHFASSQGATSPSQASEQTGKS